MSIGEFLKKEAWMPIKEAEWWKDVGTGKKDFSLSSHNKIHADATTELGSGWLQQNPDKTAGAVWGAILAAPYVAGSVAGSGGSVAGESGAVAGESGASSSPAWMKWAGKGMNGFGQGMKSANKQTPLVSFGPIYNNDSWIANDNNRQAMADALRNPNYG